MKITIYSTLLNEEFQPYLAKEQEIEYNSECDNLYSNSAIVDMMNSCFKLNEKAEEFVYVLAFNNSNARLLGIFEVSHGSINLSYIPVREIFMKSLLIGATNIILVHNHPSGTKEPSLQDIESTERVKNAGDILGISLTDHIIITKNDFYSFAEKRLS